MKILFFDNIIGSALNIAMTMSHTKGQPYITYIMGGLEGNRNLALHATAR